MMTDPSSAPSMDSATDSATDSVTTRLLQRDGSLIERAASRARTRWFRLVTPALDGHGTRFLPEGGILDEHKRNPVVAWCHSTGSNRVGSPPDPRHAIGKVVDYDQNREALDILVEFDDEPLADLVWRKVQKGIIRACSVGAIPLEVEERDEDGIKVPVFTRWILKEATICMLGSNPEALALPAELREFARELDALTEREPPTATFPAIEQRVVENIGAAILSADMVTPAVAQREAARFPGVSMVCLYPDDVSRDALAAAFAEAAPGAPSAEPKEAYHLTLAVLCDEDQPQGWHEALVPLLRTLADGHAPIAAEVGGIVRFAGGAFCAVADSNRIGALRYELYNAMKWLQPPLAPSAEHGFVPHVTLAYLPADAPNPADQLPRLPLVFPALSLVSGGVRSDFRFASPDAVSEARSVATIGAVPASVVETVVVPLKKGRSGDGAGEAEARSEDADTEERGAEPSMKLAAGVAEELRQGLAWHEEGFSGEGLRPSTVTDARRLLRDGEWWEGKAREANAWFARHDAQEGPSRDEKGRPTPKAVARALWGGTPAKQQVRRIVAALEKRDFYLMPQSPQSHAAPATGPRRNEMPKLNQEHLMAHRGVVGHKLRTAELHAMMYDALPPEHQALRGMHRDMALGACREAQEMHRAYAAMAADHFEPDGDEMRAVPALRDADLKRELELACTAVGKLPRPVDAVVREMLGTADAGQVSSKIAGLQDDRSELIKVRTQLRSDQAAQNEARRAELIAHHTGTGLITPARAQEMRGLDPATGEKRGEPWSVTRIEAYVVDRQQAGGPVVDVQPRAGLTPAPAAGATAAAQLQPGGNPAAAAPPSNFRPSSFVRMGGNQQPVNLQATAQAVTAQMRAASIQPGAAPLELDTAAINEIAARMASGEIRVGRPDMSSIGALDGGGSGMSRV